MIAYMMKSEWILYLVSTLVIPEIYGQGAITQVNRLNCIYFVVSQRLEKCYIFPMFTFKIKNMQRIRRLSYI